MYGKPRGRKQEAWNRHWQGAQELCIRHLQPLEGARPPGSTLEPPNVQPPTIPSVFCHIRKYLLEFWQEPLVTPSSAVDWTLGTI